MMPCNYQSNVCDYDTERLATRNLSDFPKSSDRLEVLLAKVVVGVSVLVEIHMEQQAEQWKREQGGKE